jgi:hypothetical protein
MKIIAFKDKNGKLHETEQECNHSNFIIDVKKIAYSIEGDLENNFPDNYSIVSNILSAILRTNQRLSKKYIQDIIDYCESQIDYDD